MILTSLIDADRYADLHPRFAGALAFLRENDLAVLTPGRHVLDGECLYANVDPGQGRGREGAVLEAHRKYIDIQYLVHGGETMGWRALESCSRIRLAYDDARDVALFDDQSTTWLDLVPGQLAIFWPEDAHAPLAGAGPHRKVIVKIAV